MNKRSLTALLLATATVACASLARAQERVVAKAAASPAPAGEAAISPAAPALLASASAGPAASPAPAASASAGSRETVLQRLDRLGLDKRVLDELLSDASKVIASPTGPLAGEQRRSLLLEWRGVVDRRQSLAQLEMGAAQLVARGEREKQEGRQASSPLSPAELDRKRGELARMRAALDRDTRLSAAIALERDAATQALNAVRARGRTGTSSPEAGERDLGILPGLRPGPRSPSLASASPRSAGSQGTTGTTTSAELASLLGHPFGLPLAQQQVLELEVSTRQRCLKALESLIEVLAAGVEAAGSAPPVSAAEVTSREQRQLEAAREVARDQTQAEATIRRAEKDQKAAEKTQREAAAQVAAASSAEERELAAARTRMGVAEKQAAEALKTLGQLGAEAGTANLARTERDVDLYRCLLRLATDPPSAAEVSARLRELRAQVQALKVRDQSYAARLQQVKDEQIQLGAARSAAEKTARGKGKLAEAAARETRAIEGQRSTLDEQAVTLAKILENVRGTLEASSRLQAELERVIGEEGLLVRRRPELAAGPLRGLFDDVRHLFTHPERSFRPARDFFVGVWRAFTQDQTGAVALPMVLCTLIGLGVAVYGHRALRHLARQASALQGPATGASVSLAAVAVLWVPVLLPAVLGRVLIPAQARGFEVALLWMVPAFTSHLVLRLTRKWFLVPQVAPGTVPVETLPGAAWVDLVMPPVPPGDLCVQERAICVRLHSTLVPVALSSCTLLPAYLTMRAALYRPELAAQLWLVYELLLAWLLFRSVRLRAELVQVRRAAGTARPASVQVVASLRAIALVCLPAVPLVEAFGFGSLARFLVTRAGLTVLVAHVVRLVFEAVLELWKRPGTETELEADETEDARGHGTLGELVGSLLSLLLIAGTAFALFWIWGGTWGAWDAGLRLAGRSMAVMGFELSLRGFVEAALALWLARWVAGLTDWFLERRFFPRTDFDSGMKYALSQTARYLIFAAGVFFALDAVGVGLEGVKWLMGFAGIGIGFGMQNIIQNFIAGLIVLYERPVRVGDVVDVKGVFGIIQRISVRSTLVRQTSNIDVFVPNSVLVSEHVVNWSLRGQRVRLEIPLALKPDADPEQARQVMLAAAQGEPAVLKRPAPTVLCEKATEASLGLLLLVWVKTPLRVREIRSNLLFAVLSDLRQAGLAPARAGETADAATAAPGDPGVVPGADR